MTRTSRPSISQHTAMFRAPVSVRRIGVVRGTDAVSILKKRMVPLSLLLGILALLLALNFLPSTTRAQALQVNYGGKGIQSLSFAGLVLEDTNANPADIFHIGHMKATDLQGNTLTDPQSVWGENNSGTSWDGVTHTETYLFSWGSIRVQFRDQGNTLDMIVTETNNPGSGVRVAGAEIYALALHFPQEPAMFSGYSQYAITTTAPGVSVADFGAAVVTSVIPDETIPMYGGWKTSGANTYSPLMTTTAPDGLATFLPHIDRFVDPGASLSYVVSLRFTPAGTAADASDAYASFARTYPSQLNWADRRILGTAYLASAPASPGDKTQPGGFPTNPRRYFADGSVNVATAAGLRAFQDRILGVAAANVANAQAMNAQGVITWDLEGEQYPMDTSYVCSPDQIATVAPEMETPVLNPGSPFAGQKLDDAYFKTMTNAGLKVGVCLRPQAFVQASNGTASQNFLNTNAAIIDTLERKARFANARWGASVFYVDSTVDVNGGVLDPAIFQQLITDFPSFLFIPEESTPRYYAYSAPFYSFIFHTDIGTDPSVRNYYPNAFGANLVNDVDPGVLQAHQAQLIQAVAKGDILMGHADYWQANDATLVSIYQAAGRNTTPVAQVTPSITWPSPAPISSGTALSSQQLNAVASTAGSFVYVPPAGTVLNSGTNTLQTTFTPSDTTTYTSASASVGLLVNGDFTSPTAPTTPTTPTTPTAPTASLYIVSPSPQQVLSGIVRVEEFCSLALDAAGTYLLVDGQPYGSQRFTSGPFVYSVDTRTLSNGLHALQLWAHDIGNNVTLSATVPVAIQN